MGSPVVRSHTDSSAAAERVTDSASSSLLLAPAGVTLPVGGIGVANTMVISVLERRAEIGLRWALGTARGHIRARFLTESITLSALSALGGLAGIALGSLSTAAYAASHAWPVVIPAEALDGALLVRALAGFHPSVRAARMTPTAALSAP
ncbi:MULTISPECIES: ABC transporter permease [Catenuloplanes]|uniref:ABC-type antimicrobial peptide transport system permease subunit n=1 Tax=Catenuloplanes niger TaxID=587534 RepID=A0AAE3ZX10_9ACTN|nr:ABC transporter permease [Catenuloplanes niger]MDR7327588.1 ABC-type antimicrobial peptide transport system permease subunit [Catenuloplanes niger]